MLAEAPSATWTWLSTGSELFGEMVGAIETARESVLLETYIFSPGKVANRLREALVRAQQRGVQVRVLLDALGSMALPGDFWASLTQLGGDMRFFNPLSLDRLGIRDHRKLLVCDDRVAFVGGFNIADEYEGDGVERGWCDVGLKLTGPVASQLGDAFEEMFSLAEFRHKRFIRLRRPQSKKAVQTPEEQLLLSGPGRGFNPIRRALKRDLARARSVQIMVGYFLPTWRIRRQLGRVVRRGGTVELVLAGKSDVVIAQLAAQSLYRRLLKSGLSILEYQPQVLHAKLLVIEDAVYVGSANLDQRSLNINYELMVRLQGQQVAEEARTLIARKRLYCKEVTLDSWRKGRTLWRRIKQRWAYFLLVRVDPYLARKQWTALPD